MPGPSRRQHRAVTPFMSRRSKDISMPCFSCLHASSSIHFLDTFIPTTCILLHSQLSGSALAPTRSRLVHSLPRHIRRSPCQLAPLAALARASNILSFSTLIGVGCTRPLAPPTATQGTPGMPLFVLMMLLVPRIVLLTEPRTQVRTASRLLATLFRYSSLLVRMLALVSTSWTLPTRSTNPSISSTRSSRSMLMCRNCRVAWCAQTKDTWCLNSC